MFLQKLYPSNCNCNWFTGNEPRASKMPVVNYSDELVAENTQSFLAMKFVDDSHNNNSQELATASFPELIDGFDIESVRGKDFGQTFFFSTFQ